LLLTVLLAAPAAPLVTKPICTQLAPIIKKDLDVHFSPVRYTIHQTSPLRFVDMWALVLIGLLAAVTTNALDVAWSWDPKCNPTTPWARAHIHRSEDQLLVGTHMGGLGNSIQCIVFTVMYAISTGRRAALYEDLPAWHRRCGDDAGADRVPWASLQLTAHFNTTMLLEPHDLALPPTGDIYVVGQPPWWTCSRVPLNDLWSNWSTPDVYVFPYYYTVHVRQPIRFPHADRLPVGYGPTYRDTYACVMRSIFHRPIGPLRVEWAKLRPQLVSPWTVAIHVRVGDALSGRRPGSADRRLSVPVDMALVSRLRACAGDRATAVFVTSDSMAVLAQVRAQWPDAITTAGQVVHSVDDGGGTSLLKLYLDWLALAHADEIVITASSTFSSMAALIGNVPVRKCHLYHKE
jgi:hypothetical protein